MTTRVTTCIVGPSRSPITAAKVMRPNKSVRSLAMLSQLAGLLDCSLARYLSNARPWCRRPYLLLGALVRRLAFEHEHYTGEIARLLHARRHTVNSHTFPMEFTYYNDLSLEFLAPRLLDHQRRLIKFANAASEELTGDYEAQRLITNLRASLRQYGALLEELLAPHRLAPAPSHEVMPAAEIPGHSLIQAKKRRSLHANRKRLPKGWRNPQSVLFSDDRELF